MIQNLRQRATDYYYNPPQSAVNAGVVKRKSFPLSEIDTAIKYAEESNAALADWRKETKHIAGLQKDGRVKDAVFAYLHSVDYTSLTDRTRSAYKAAIDSWVNVRVAGMPLQNCKLSSLETPMIQRMYDSEVMRTTPHVANNHLSVYRLVFNYAIRCGYTKYNPFEKIKKKTTKHRKVMWDRQDVMAFLNTAFGKWEWRNVGIIFYMIYEWGQRVSDILNLKWSNIDFDSRTVTIRQSKKDAIVKLPISEGLLKMLIQQKKDFFLSEFVAPQMVRRHGKFTPYSISTVNSYVTAIMLKAKIDGSLQLRDLRRTAITETIENGGDLLTVMQMSGHQSAASVTPYFVHTRKGAAKAQEIRQFPSHLIGDVALLQRRASA